MDAQFWINAWNEGRTNFHQGNYNQTLLEYFPQLNPLEGQRVLVPLCGKSKDLIWLHDLKLQVHGVELYEEPVKDFFKENELSPVEKKQDQTFINYVHKNIVISSGDFFNLNANASYDFIYDRAALVALPASMRKSYAGVIIKSLKRGGKCLLVVYEYDQTKLEGPPFSVDEKEIHELYGDQFSIKLVESKTPSKEGSRLSSLDNSLKQKVYILEKNI